MTLSSDDIASIVDHMNQDHADTLVNYVRYFGGVEEVISATLNTITPTELHIDVIAHSLSCKLAIPLIRTIQQVGEARTILVEMAKLARAGLHGEQEETSNDDG